jgi:hypothetical protein
MTNVSEITKKVFIFMVVLVTILIALSAPSEANLFDETYPQIIDALMKLDITSALSITQKAAKTASMGTTGSEAVKYDPLTGEMLYSDSYYDSRDAMDKLQAVESAFFDGGIHSMGNLGRQVAELNNAGFSDDRSAARLVKTSWENAALFSEWVSGQSWITADDKQRLIDNANNNYAGAIKAKYDAYVASETENLKRREREVAEQAKRDAETDEKDRQLWAERQKLEDAERERERAQLQRQAEKAIEARRKERQNQQRPIANEQEAEQFMKQYHYNDAALDDRLFGNPEIASLISVKHYGFSGVNETFFDRLYGIKTEYEEGFVMEILNRRSGLRLANIFFMITRDGRVFLRPTTGTSSSWVAM